MLQSAPPAAGLHATIAMQTSNQHQFIGRLLLEAIFYKRGALRTYAHVSQISALERKVHDLEAEAMRSAVDVEELKKRIHRPNSKSRKISAENL